MKAKKVLSVMLASAMVLGLAGCSGSSSGGSSDGGDGEVINLTIWSPTDEEAIEDWLVVKLAQRNEDNPDI